MKRRRLQVTFVCLVMLGIAIAIVPAAPRGTEIDGDATGPGCALDPASGIAVPTDTPGICVNRTAAGVALVRSHRSGLVITTVAPGATGSGRALRGEGGSLGIDDPIALVTFCPRRLLNPLTNVPGPECLDASSDLEPGEAAFIGVGHLRANLVVTPTGEAACLSSMHLDAEVTSPGGEAFSVEELLSFVPSSSAAGCTAGQDDLRVTFDDHAATVDPSDRARQRGTAEGLDRTWRSMRAEASRFADWDVDRWNVAEQLLALDDAEWALLRALIELTPEELDQLLHWIDANPAGVSPGPALPATAGDGAPSDVVEFGPGGDDSSDPIDPIDLPEGSLRDVFIRVVQIKSSVGGNLKARIPDRGDVRNLLQELRGETIDRVRTLITRAKDEVKGALDLVSELRDDNQYTQWLGNECNAASDCGRFRTDLENVIDDLAGLWEDVQRLGCIHKSDLKIRDLPGLGRGQLLRNLAVGKPDGSGGPPKLLLFGLYRILSLTDPDDPEATDRWNLRVSNIRERVPLDLLCFCSEDVNPACESNSAGFAQVPIWNTGVSANAGDLAGPGAGSTWEPTISSAALCGEDQVVDGARLCRPLRNRVVYNSLRTMRVLMNDGIFVFDLYKAISVKESSVGIKVTAVGGGGATITYPNPAHAAASITKMVIQRLDKGVAWLLDKRRDCLSDDARLEGNLASCSGIVANYFPRSECGDFDDLGEMVERRIGEFCEEDECIAARRDLATARASIDYPTLCTAYSKIANDPCRDSVDDFDGDSIADDCDNCFGHPNLSQLDTDADGWGDACDNCPLAANDQTDTDGDGVGDACMDDFPGDDGDGDGVNDDVDNCPDVPNADQADTDGDGTGDACDDAGSGEDRDDDGVADEIDNCPDDANPEQADRDEDGEGDACDDCQPVGDQDEDGVCNDLDNCPETVNPSQIDSDGDSVGDNCDNCPETSNQSQADSDADGFGDACDVNPFGGI